MFDDLQKTIWRLMANSSAINAAKNLFLRPKEEANDSVPNQDLAGSMKGVYEEQIRLECQGRCDASLTKAVKFSTRDTNEDLPELAIYVGCLTLLLLLGTIMLVLWRSKAKRQIPDKIAYPFPLGQKFSPID